MALNFCSNCGAKLRVGAKFCSSCGQKIQQEEKKLPPMPYEKSKNILELYTEKKEAAKKTTAPTVHLEKKSSVIQDNVTAQVIDSNTESTSTNTTTQKPVPKTMAEIYAETKAKLQSQVTSKQSTESQSTYTPSVTTNYKEDTTIEEKFLSTEGRLNRMRYFKRWLAVDLSFFAFVIIIFLTCTTPLGDLTPVGSNILDFSALAILIPKYCLDVRRMKDIGKDENFIKVVAGLNVVLSIIYIYGTSDWNYPEKMPQGLHAIVMIMFGIFVWLQKNVGTVGTNKYGPDPLENERRMNL